jgi:SET and MYND domain-containing protein 4
VKDFIIKCTECGEFTNIMKGLKALQDTDVLFKTAIRLHDSGDTKKALVKYVEMMKILDENLMPPFRDYNVCQQGIRRCFLELGNRAIVK